MPHTLVIIPTYNEKENIERLIEQIFSRAGDIGVLIVDDDSKDGTAEIADKIALRDKRVTVLHRRANRGRGYAGIDAFKEALKRKDILCIIEMDADFSHDPAYIPSFLEEIKKNDIVIGSRFVKGGRDNERNFIRNFLSKTSNFFIKRYLGLKVNDCSAGYRCFRRRVILSLDLDKIVSKGPAVIEEMLYISSLKGFRIKEIPIDFKARHKGKTKLNPMKLCRVFTDILFFKKVHAPEHKRKEIEEIKMFGFRFALALNILGCIMFYRGKGHFIWFTDIGSLNLILAILCPAALFPLKRTLDNIILWFGRLVNLVSLSIVFYIIFAPIGILLRLFGKDILNERLDKNSDSYWIKKEKAVFNPESYGHMG